MERKVRLAMRDAENKAWASLAGYKFYMFGYHAAQWVKLNKLLPKSEPNPFKELVKVAKGGRRENQSQGRKTGS